MLTESCIISLNHLGCTFLEGKPMFLKINTTKTNTRLGHATHIISDAASMLGGIASVTVLRSSQAEVMQLLRLQKLMRHLTQCSDSRLRLAVFTYGEARFKGLTAEVKLDPGVKAIVNGYVDAVKLPKAEAA